MTKMKRESILLPFDENSPGLSGYVRAAVRYMAVHYGESEITVAQIADAVGISEGHLSHCFKKETGYTVIAYFSSTFKKVTGITPSEYQNR